MTMTADIRLREFMHRRDNWRSIAAVAGHLALVFAPVFLAAYFGSWPWFVAGYIWFGLTQNGVANLMHEAAHRMVFSDSKWSDLLGRWVLAPFFLTNFELYRRRHWVHHKMVGTADDTKETYLIEFRGIKGLIAFALRCLVGVEAARRFAVTLKENEFVTPLTGKEKREGFVSLLTFHAIFAVALFVTALLGRQGDFSAAVIQAALAYVVIYIYGMASCTIFLSTLRAVAEHQIVLEDPHVVGHAAIRNLRPTPITRALLGSYGFCEHGTHHAYPAIPYYNLEAATGALSADDPLLLYGPSYWAVIARTTHRTHEART
jgi:fatty acid desaturase